MATKIIKILKLFQCRRYRTLLSLSNRITLNEKSIADDLFRNKKSCYGRRYVTYIVVMATEIIFYGNLASPTPSSATTSASLKILSGDGIPWKRELFLRIWSIRLLGVVGRLVAMVTSCFQVNLIANNFSAPPLAPSPGNVATPLAPPP